MSHRLLPAAFAIIVTGCAQELPLELAQQLVESGQEEPLYCTTEIRVKDGNFYRYREKQYRNDNELKESNNCLRILLREEYITSWCEDSEPRTDERWMSPCGNIRIRTREPRTKILDGMLAVQCAHNARRVVTVTRNGRHAQIGVAQSPRYIPVLNELVGNCLRRPSLAATNVLHARSENGTWRLDSESVAPTQRDRMDDAGERRNKK